MEAIKDLITCGVCLEIFTNPQLLPCLHTLCEPCLKLLCKGGEVMCPECRDVSAFAAAKKNFHSQSLIDVYNQNQRPLSSRPRKPSSRDCEICGRGKVSCRCIECAKMLCGDCKKNHASIPSCADHSFEDIKTLCAQGQNKLSSLKKRLVAMKKTCRRKMGDADDYAAKLKGVKQDCAAKLDAAEQATVQKVKDAFDGYRTRIKNEIGLEEKRLTKVDRRAKFAYAEINEMLELIQEVSESSADPVRMLSATNELSEGIEEQLKDLMVENMQLGDIKVKLNTSDLGGLDDLVKYEVLQLRETCDRRYTGQLLKSLCGSPMRRSHCITASKGSITRFYIIDGNFVLLTPDAVLFVSIEGEERKTIKHEMLQNPCGMAQTHDKDLVIACGETDEFEASVLQFSKDGTFKSVLIHEDICDVAASGTHLFMLNYKTKRVAVYCQTSDGKWKASSSIQIEEQCRFSSLDSLLATSVSVLVCCAREGRVLEVTHTGQRMNDKTFPLRSGSATAAKEKEQKDKCAAILCSLDESGAVLCLEKKSGRMSVLDAHRQWRSVELKGKDVVKECACASMDAQGRLWVSRGGQLHCFEIGN